MRAKLLSLVNSTAFSYIATAAMIAGVLAVAYCQTGTLPNVPRGKVDQAQALDAFFLANSATKAARDVCVACDEEMAEAGSVELAPPCLVRCMDATSDAVQAAKYFASTLGPAE